MPPELTEVSSTEGSEYGDTAESVKQERVSAWPKELKGAGAKGEHRTVESVSEVTVPVDLEHVPEERVSIKKVPSEKMNSFDMEETSSRLSSESQVHVPIICW